MDITFRDPARECDIELERNEQGDVIAIHITFYDPRPLTDFIRYDFLLYPGALNPYAPRVVQGAAPTGPGSAPRPCGGGR
jgi:hypothetical protein